MLLLFCNDYDIFSTFFLRSYNSCRKVKEVKKFDESPTSILVYKMLMTSEFIVAVSSKPSKTFLLCETDFKGKIFTVEFTKSIFGPHKPMFHEYHLQRRFFAQRCEKFVIFEMQGFEFRSETRKVFKDPVLRLWMFQKSLDLKNVTRLSISSM